MNYPSKLTVAKVVVGLVVCLSISCLCAQSKPSTGSSPATATALPSEATVEGFLKRSSWKFLDKVPMNSIGQVPVAAVRFDASRRKELDPSCLDDFALKTEP